MPQVGMAVTFSAFPPPSSGALLEGIALRGFHEQHMSVLLELRRSLNDAVTVAKVGGHVCRSVERQLPEISFARRSGVSGSDVQVRQPRCGVLFCASAQCAGLTQSSFGHLLETNRSQIFRKESAGFLKTATESVFGNAWSASGKARVRPQSLKALRSNSWLDSHPREGIAMNRICRVVFNRVVGRWVVASELAKGRKKGQGSSEPKVMRVVLVAGVLGSLTGPAYASLVVNNNPQESGGAVSCVYKDDDGGTAWTSGAGSNERCLTPSMEGTASKQGDAGKNAIFYASSLVGGEENSLNLGGYLDVWKTATFHSSVDMSGQKITGLANGTAETDAVNMSQLTAATTSNRYFKTSGLNDGTDDASIQGSSVGIGAGAQALAAGSQYNPTPYSNSVAIGAGAFAMGAGSVAIGDHANASNTNIAIGAGANASGESRNVMALGIGSLVTAGNSVALGSQSVADRTSTISMGRPGNERQIVNVARGTADTDTVNVSQLKGIAGALGGNAAVNADGTVKAPSYALAEANEINDTTTAPAATNVGAAFDTVDSALGMLDTAITDITNDINEGTAGLVQQAASGQNLTVGKDTDGTAVDFARTGGATRTLKNVTAGVADHDAVNVAQLNTTNSNVTRVEGEADQQGNTVAAALGGSAVYNAATGAITAPSYALTNANEISGALTGPADTNVGDAFATVDSALGVLDTRVTQNTTNITELETSITNINNGTGGLVQQAAPSQNLTVGKDTDGTAVDFSGTSGERKLTGVADGTVVVDSKQAVNGGQLYTTNQAVTQNTVDIDALDSRVAINEGDISTLQTDVTNIDGRVTNVEGSVTDITNQINGGEIGLVQYDSAAQSVTVAKAQAGTAVDFRNNGGLARRLKGVAAGAEDEDSVNVAQLKNSLGGDARYDAATGAYLGPAYSLTNADGSTIVTNGVGDAITNLDGRIYTNTTAIADLNTRIDSAVGEGLVQQSAAGAKLTVGKDTDGVEVDFAAKDGSARKLGNVGDGAVVAGSRDAVNGGQLHRTSQSVANALGGGSVVNADGTVLAPSYTMTNSNGTAAQVIGVEGAVTYLDNRVSQNTTAIAGNSQAITNLTQQISNAGLGMVKQDATTRQITVARDADGASVNFAGTTGDRTLSGVAAGNADNDAVNVRQMKAAGVIGANGESKAVVTYDDAGKTGISLGGAGANTAVTVRNVADGVDDLDAVNVSQLNQRMQQNTTEVLVQANDYTDQRIDDVWSGVGQLSREVVKQDRRISQHGAMSMAAVQMASGAAAAAVGSLNGAWSVGLGFEQGYAAISAGYAKPVGKKSQISFGAAFGGDESSVGVGFAQKL